MRCRSKGNSRVDPYCTRAPDGSLVLGAAASAFSVASHLAVASAYPAVARSARLIGSLQAQNRASLGGNICNAAPSADAVPALICHQASVRIAGPGGSRMNCLETFVRGPGSTSLAGTPAFDRLASYRTEISRHLPALHPAPRNGHCHSRNRRLGSSRRREQDRGGSSCACVGWADADPCNISGAASHRASDPLQRCSKLPAALQQATRAPFPTRAVRPTIAARWSPY